MKRLLAFTVLLCLSPVLWAEEVSTKPGVFVVVDSKTTGIVKWVNSYEELQLKASKEGWAVVSSTKPGKYKVAWYTCTKDGPTDPVYITVVVSGSSPEPIPEALTKSLKDAYAKDTDKTKVGITTLQVLYETWATAILEDDKVANLKNWGQLHKALKDASKTAGLKDTDVVNLRGAVSTHLKTKLPSEAEKALDKDGRSTASSAFSSVANALKEVAK